MVKKTIDKKKLKEVTEEDIQDIKSDSRSQEAIGGIADFYKVACKKCKRRLTLFIPKMLVMRKSNIEEWVKEKICDDCKEYLV